MPARYGYGQTKVRNSPAPSEKWLREASFTKGLSTSARMDAAMDKRKKKKKKRRAHLSKIESMTPKEATRISKIAGNRLLPEINRLRAERSKTGTKIGKHIRDTTRGY